MNYLDEELVASMRKHPGIFIGGKNYKRVEFILSNILKIVLHNNNEPVNIEWIIEDEKTCQLNIVGGNMACLKEKLENYIRIEELPKTSKYLYYMYLIYLSQVDMTFIYNHKCISIKKKPDILVYDCESTSEENKCSMKFTLDSEIFSKKTLLYKPLSEYVQMYAYQYPKLTIVSKDERALKQENTYHYPNGLQDKLDYFKFLKNGESEPLWEVRHNCIIEGFAIHLCFCIEEHVYISPSDTVIYAEDDLVLYEDCTIKHAVIKAMKQSMEDFSKKHNLELAFKEEQLSYLTDFVASIHGNGLEYGGSFKTNLNMPTLKAKLVKHMKSYFDELFSSDDKYMELLNKIGFKKGNTLFLDAVFSSDDMN